MVHTAVQCGITVSKLYIRLRNFTKMLLLLIFIEIKYDFDLIIVLDKVIKLFNVDLTFRFVAKYSHPQISDN